MMVNLNSMLFAHPENFVLHSLPTISLTKKLKSEGKKWWKSTSVTREEAKQ
jgi:hypothetical protein